MMMHIASSLGFCESNIWTSFPLPCKLPKYSRSSVRKTGARKANANANAAFVSQGDGAGTLGGRADNK